MRDHTDTTEVAALDPDTETGPIPDISEAGAFLLGASERVSDHIYRLGAGRAVIGRAERLPVLKHLRRAYSQRSVSSRLS
ncbi:MAG: hypothetical protein QF921_04725 [Pseudomonadales bacterium]|nr:hypothetical protein [Pseudomonadales bacterium]MDP6472980.1 hypothetical protein [Pseudomonadales bacterium]MDP6826264.1 hypothetical protein [Pseudomonadales bacterium]MDP6970806.1 hypothetical protein [Pseudomonadales bacterium]